VWAILYLPFGALGGFVQIALTFLATKNGLSISEGALLNGANLLTQWLKWIWAPAVDVTLTPRKWYLLSTAASAAGVFAMSVIPLGPDTLVVLLPIIALASLINSNVGMAVEALIAVSTPPDQVGRVSAWFQAGNLGGTSFGGALGLFLVMHLPGWMAGLIMGAAFMACSFALLFTPPFEGKHHGNALAGVKSVVRDLRSMLKTKGGLLSAILCVLPIGTGAAQAVLTQAKVAAFWGASEHEVELMQGVAAGVVTAVGCFVGGWICTRLHPRIAYAMIGVLMAVVAGSMAATPTQVLWYEVFSLLYAFTVGLAYSAFTALVLVSMGEGSGATKYNIFASLSNFPIWWLGLALGLAADKGGPRAMLVTEAGFGILGVLVFAGATTLVRRSRRLADV
jgi:hypothetical protein